MKNTYREIRTMSMENLRGLCIRFGWYTLGNDREYDNLLSRTKVSNITTKDLVWLAQNLLDHSDTDYDIPSIMFELSKICTTYFMEV